MTGETRWLHVFTQKLRRQTLVHTTDSGRLVADSAIDADPPLSPAARPEGIRAPIVGRCGPIAAQHHRGEGHLVATTDIWARLPVCPVRRVALEQHARIRATRAVVVASFSSGIRMQLTTQHLRLLMGNVLVKKLARPRSRRGS